MTEATSSPSADEFVCPEAEHHGKPFRYCLVKGCGWIEESDSPNAPSLTLEQRLARVECELADLVQKTDKQNELLQTIADAVGPTIESLKSSAIGKMFGM